MKLILTLVFLLLTVNFALGAIYRYEDPDGTIHFSDSDKDPRFKKFVKDIKPLPQADIAGNIFRKALPNASVFAVNRSSRRDTYFWLFGDQQKDLH